MTITETATTLHTCWACTGTGQDFGGTCAVCGGSGSTEEDGFTPTRGAMGASLGHARGQGQGSGTRTGATPTSGQVRFRKIGDEWGCSGPANLVVEGQEVTITKASGDTVVRTVGRIVEVANKYGDTVALLAKDAPKATTPVTEGLDLSDLPAARYAVPGGDTRLKLRVDKPSKGTWAGWVFVKDAAEYGTGRTYGKARPGERYAGGVQDALRAIMADPQAALKAYGDLTGTCGVCGRHLEDETSVERGIGPHCWAKLGF